MVIAVLAHHVYVLLETQLLTVQTHNCYHVQRRPCLLMSVSSQRLPGVLACACCN